MDDAGSGGRSGTMGDAPDRCCGGHAAREGGRSLPAVGGHDPDHGRARTIASLTTPSGDTVLVGFLPTGVVSLAVDLFPWDEVEALAAALQQRGLRLSTGRVAQ